MRKRKFLLFLTVLSVVLLTGSFCSSSFAAAEKIPKVGPVKVNPHPASLEGKTVVLRWNSKLNGDKYLTRVAELLSQQVKNVKVIKMWETDKSTAAIAKDGPDSERITASIAKLKPDLVIASQAD
jgi:hypothetical protein